MTLFSNASKKLVYSGSNHTVIPVCTVPSCRSRTGRGEWNRVVLLAVGTSACLPRVIVNYL